MLMRKKLFIKLLFLLCSIINILNVLIIYNVPATNGYEFSIYDIYPWYLWFFFGLTVFISSLLVVNNALFSKGKETHWILGLIILFISYTPFLFLPIIRNYAVFGRGDVLSHIGLIRNILSSGQIGQNMYPSSHIFLAISSLTASISEISLISLLTDFFLLIYFIFLYVLYKQILVERDKIFIAYVFSFLIYMRTAQFYPSTFANAFIPIILYLCLKGYNSFNSWEYKLLVIIMLIFIIFSHPFLSIILACLFLMLDTSNFIIKRFTKRDKEFNLFTKNFILLNTALIFTWGSWSYIVIRSLGKIFGFISKEITDSDFGIYSQLFSRFALGINDVISYAVFVYGKTAIVLALSAILIIYTYYSLYLVRGRIIVSSHYIFASLVFCIFCIICASAFFLPLCFSFDRFLAYPIIFSLILIPDSISYISKGSTIPIIRNTRSIHGMLIYICIIVIVVSLVYLCAYTFYDSSKTRLLNPQVTNGELAGMAMFFNIRNDSLLIRDLGPNQERFFDAIHGERMPKKNVFISQNPIDHFGYDKYPSQKYLYENDTYILISTSGREMDQAIIPEYSSKWRFLPHDFIKLNNDSSVYKTYTNHDLETYLVNSKV